MWCLRWPIVVICLALLGGCLTPPTTFDDIHTGQRGVLSGRAIVGRDISSLVYAQVGYSQSKDSYAVFTEYQTVEGIYVYPTEAWSFGKEIAYTHLDRLKVSCATGCVAVERGRLRLSREEFEMAAREGLEFRLVGRRALVLCRLPAEMFQQVLRLAKQELPPSASASLEN